MIVRGTRPADRFTIVANAALEDDRLSWRARGILAYMLGRPEGWQTSAERLAKQGTEGRDAVRAALGELEALGYMARVKSQDSRGRWITTLVVHDTPTEPRTPSTDDGFPVVGKPGVGETADPSTDVGFPGVGGSTIGGFPVVGEPAVGEPGAISKKDYQEGSTTPSSSSPVISPKYSEPYPGGGMPVARLAWYPTEATVAGAADVYPWATRVAMKEVTMKVIAYCSKKKRQPDDALWLTFMSNENKDREKAERDEAAAKAEAAPKTPWYEQ